jgi:7-carboxy-7-deazaguanine synthase (Cx14CxxC type)
MSYKVKEMFYSLQGEGARAGRAAVFCRFSKCNLWNGREIDRAKAVCNFCDTDILGTDGQNGGVFEGADMLAERISDMWLTHQAGSAEEIKWQTADQLKARPYVIFTGGEPLLQLDSSLVNAMHQKGFEVAVETNGTLPLVPGIDWVCLSPKGVSTVVIDRCDELKLVYPQSDIQPEDCAGFDAKYYFLSPMASINQRQGPDATKDSNTRKALAYCLANPQWRLTIQLHKLLGID